MTERATLEPRRATRGPMTPFYPALRALARFWVWFFFRRVDVRHPARVPPWGPVLLCANHPNNLIDSLLLGIAVPRQVHYLATAALSLPLSGVGAYHYLRGLERLSRGLRFGVLALTQEHAAHTLLDERQALMAELDRAKADYLAATRGSSF